MVVLHLSNTPLVGATYWWSACMNKSGLVQSRSWAAHWRYPDGKEFPHDVGTREEALDLLRRADRVMVHNRPLSGFAVPREKLRFVVHSTPGMVDGILLMAAPKAAAIAQYHSRYYRNRKDLVLLPNLLDLAVYPRPVRSGPVYVGFSPSNVREYDRRNPVEYMNTKEPEATSAILRACEAAGMRVGVWRKTPWAALMRLRGECDVVVDEVATGSYHRTSLEAAASAQVPVNAADAHTLSCMARVSGTATHPFMLSSLASLEAGLRMAGAHPEGTRALGREARAWMERWWEPTELVRRCFLPFLE